MALMAHTAGHWIDLLRLQPHPEGGYYRVTYEAEQMIEQGALPDSFAGPRRASTAIYFLLQRGDFSAFHRIPSDELWHFYAGDALQIHIINAAGVIRTIDLGRNVASGEAFQAVVPADHWFASEPKGESAYALVGCTVAPGFDFTDFQLAARDELLREYPQHKKLIERLTR